MTTEQLSLFNQDAQQAPLKPAFDDEFPNSEQVLTDREGTLYENSGFTPAMLGYRSRDTGEVEIPLTSEEVAVAKEDAGSSIDDPQDLGVDEAHQTAVRLAKKYGGHPDDWNPNLY
jgi:hypothetical protein